MSQVILRGVVSLLAISTFALAAPATKSGTSSTTTPKKLEVPKPPKGMKDVTKLTTKELKSGKGKKAEAGKEVIVHYTGWLTNGTQFDSSVERAQPFSFQLGSGMVIKGWDEGVKGMKVGGKRLLHIPPDMGYGPNGSPPVIPPNATLHFQVELLDVKS